MALADTLKAKAAAKEAAALEQKEREKAEKEAARLAGIQDKMALLDPKIEEMQALLANLKKTHEKAGASVTSAKKESKALTAAQTEVQKVVDNPQFKDLLAEEGIHSVDDLLKAEGYAEDEQVKTVKGLKQSRAEKRSSAREDIKARREAKKEAHLAMTAESKVMTTTLKYKDIVAALEKLIENFSKERKELFDQTPEGQETKKKEFVERIGKRHSVFKHYFDRNQETRDNIRVLDCVRQDDLKDAEEYSEAEVKAAIKDYFGGLIDENFTNTFERQNDKKLSAAVEILEALPKQWKEAEAKLRKLAELKEATIQNLAELLKENKDLTARIAGYGGWGQKPIPEMAKTFVDHFSGLNAPILDLSGVYGDSIEKAFGQVVSAQQELVRDTLQTSLSVLFGRENIRVLILNPEMIVAAIAEQEEFYKRFQALIDDPENFLKEFRRDHEFASVLKIKHRREFVRNDQSIIDRDIEFPAGTVNLLRREGNFTYIKSRLDQKRQQDERQAQQYKDQLAAKVEWDWVKAELNKFKQEHGKTLPEIQEIVKSKKTADELNLVLDKTITELDHPKKTLESEVIWHENGLFFTDATYENFEQISKDLKKIDDELKDIDNKLGSIRNRAYKEGDGVFGGKKRKRDAEIEELNKEKGEVDAKRGTLQAEYNRKGKKRGELVGINWVLQKIKEQEIQSPHTYNVYDRKRLARMPSKSMSLKDFIENIREQLRQYELAAEQAEINKQHQALLKKQEKAQKAYQNLSRS